MINTGGIQVLILLVATLLGLGVVPSLASADPTKTVDVDCARGQTIAGALETGDERKPLVVVVEGTCTENVVVTRDDVMLQGHPVAGGAVVGTDPARSTIVIQGGRRVTVDSLTVSGARHGVAGVDGASFTVRNSILQNNAFAGVLVISGSSGTLTQNRHVNNGTNGVAITDNSTGVVTGSTVEGNGGAGIFVARSSSARIGRTLAGISAPNEIRSNGGPGISVYQAAQALIDGNAIRNNSGNGVFIDGASATVTNNTISSNVIKGIEVTNAGNARIGVNDNAQPGPNTIQFNGFEGIQITNSSAAFMLGNTIQSNGLDADPIRPGVGIYRATGRLIGDNMIQGSGGNGVEVSQGALWQGRGDFFNLTPGADTIQGNALSGIFAFNGATLDIRKAIISGNSQHGIALNTHAVLRISGSTVSGNTGHGIRLDFDSGLHFRPPVTSVAGNGAFGVSCGDTESSFVGDTSGVTGNAGGDVSCTGF